jgi:hypothetical protein
MSNLVRRWMNDTVTLWLSSGVTDDEGRRIVGAPSEIRCRFEQGEGEFIDDDGETVGYDAVAAVAQSVPIGSIMRQGTIAEYQADKLAGVSPLGLHEVVKFRSAGDITGQYRQTELVLKRFSDTIVEA